MKRRGRSCPDGVVSQSQSDWRSQPGQAPPSPGPPPPPLIRLLILMAAAPQEAASRHRWTRDARPRDSPPDRNRKAHHHRAARSLRTPCLGRRLHLACWPPHGNTMQSFFKSRWGRKYSRLGPAAGRGFLKVGLELCDSRMSTSLA